MKILNLTNENKDDLKSFILNKLNAIETIDEFDWSDDSYYYEYMLENFDKMKNEDFLLLLDTNNEILDIIYIEDYNDFKIICPAFCSDEVAKKEINLLKEAFPIDILQIDKHAFYGVKEYDLKELSLKSSINEKNRYNLFHNRVLGTYKGDTDMLVKYFEKKNFNKVSNIENLQYQFMNPDEFSQFVQKKSDDLFGFPYWITSGNNHIAAGFRYLIPHELGDANYLAAINEGQLVGVIKCGEYGEGAQKRQSINFIDVRQDCWQLGIATKMIQELDQYLDKDIPLIVTDESDMGKKCNITEKFKNIITNTDVYSYREFADNGYSVPKKNQMDFAL